MRTSITYAERPVTAEEKAVANVLATVAKAASAQDPIQFASVLADNAKVAVIFEATQLSKEEFLKKISSLRSRRWRLAYRDVVIRVYDQQAKIYCTGLITFQGKLAPCFLNRDFTLEKYEGKWLITEAL